MRVEHRQVETPYYVGQRVDAFFRFFHIVQEDVDFRKIEYGHV